MFMKYSWLFLPAHFQMLTGHMFGEKYAKYKKKRKILQVKVHVYWFCTTKYNAHWIPLIFILLSFPSNAFVLFQLI